MHACAAIVGLRRTPTPQSIEDAKAQEIRDRYVLYRATSLMVGPADTISSRPPASSSPP